MKEASARVSLACLLMACLALSCGTSNTSHSKGERFTIDFQNSTLQEALRTIQEQQPRFVRWKFTVRSDRTFTTLVFKGILTKEDLLRQIRAQTSCDIAESGDIVVITLPRGG
jgi:hypothetical protein